MNQLLSRRGVLLGLGGGLSAITLASTPAFARTDARIVVVGGGFGGATAARTLRELLPRAQITLIEPNRTYHACPMSNLALAGRRDGTQQTFTYDAVAAEEIELVHTWAQDVDPDARTVMTRDGRVFAYDRLILSPGIAFRWGAVRGYEADAAARFPHAWTGQRQRNLLQQQLTTLENGRDVVISVPRAPYRCPPGPYERASLIAHVLKRDKPRSKVIVLDANDSFSKQALFEEAWAEHYPGQIEWRSGSTGGAVRAVDSGAGTVETDFERFQPGVANIIAPQKAASVAQAAGVTNATGWCPIDPVSFESMLQPGIHVIGDATIAAPMPKSAFSANLQGKICAIQIARLLSGQPAMATRLVNTCYSYTTPDTAISIVGAYANDNGAFQSIEGAGGTSALGASPDIRAAEARQAEDWFAAITAETFG